MHIPDGYLSPQTYIPMLGVAALFWTVAVRKIRTVLSHRHIPYLAMAAAFSFLIQMFNIPIPGGTTGHAVGGAVVAILLGPWPAVLAISIVLVIQAIVFGDGGITAIGANCFNMAVVMPFVSYWVFRMIKGSETGGKRFQAAAFFAGYIGLTTAAIATAIQFGIQPLIAQNAQGLPLYAPYPLSIALPVMAAEHLLLFGIVEGAVTAMLVQYFVKNEPDLIYACREV
ncbi:MAG TPA: cobalt transporter CbiM [Dissulfurispiraceae bacterium]|nr:cobalt transporter CbiM [Dissulfurispiraceae bacterium]